MFCRCLEHGERAPCYITPTEKFWSKPPYSIPSASISGTPIHCTHHQKRFHRRSAANFAKLSWTRYHRGRQCSVFKGTASYASGCCAYVCVLPDVRLLPSTQGRRANKVRRILARMPGRQFLNLYGSKENTASIAGKRMANVCQKNYTAVGSC